MNTSVNTAVRAAALKTKVGREVTGEVLRERALQSGTNTNTPSDWARAVSKLIKTGILSPTGKQSLRVLPKLIIARCLFISEILPVALLPKNY